MVVAFWSSLTSSAHSRSPLHTFPNSAFSLPLGIVGSGLNLLGSTTLIEFWDDLNRVGLLWTVGLEDLVVADSKKGFLGLYHCDHRSFSSSLIRRSVHN
mgnify:CR=1 FL=1